MDLKTQYTGKLNYLKLPMITIIFNVAFGKQNFVIFPSIISFYYTEFLIKC